MIFYKALSSLFLTFFLSFNLTFSQISGEGPFELSTGKDAALIGAGSAIGIAALIIMLNNDELTEEKINLFKPEDVNKFDRTAIGPYQEDILGDALLYSSYLYPLTFLAYDETRDDFGTLALMYGEVVLINNGINAMVKGLTMRNRPYVYDNDTPIENKTMIDARYSFYSGHTSITASNSFFMAKVFSEYLTDNTAKILIWTAASIIPAVTGFSRVNTHYHFPTDVIVGYIVGAAIGYLIPVIHKIEKDDSVIAVSQELIHKPIFGFQFSF